MNSQKEYKNQKRQAKIQVLQSPNEYKLPKLDSFTRTAETIVRT